MSTDTQIARSSKSRKGATPAKSDCEMIEHIPFTTDKGIGQRARIGLIVLATDYTIEHEFRQIITMPDVAFYETRIKNSATITPETLAAMGPMIGSSADLLLPGSHLDVIGYGCTSASMVLGEERVFEEVKKVRPKSKVTTPITAAFAAFDAFKAKRIGVLTPYRRDVNEVVRAYIEKKGYEVPVFGSYNEQNDGVVASIDGDSIKRGVDVITKKHSVDMVFVSCTSVRLAGAAASVEKALGVPVTSSNHALAWHCLRLAGIKDKRPELGRLYTK